MYPQFDEQVMENIYSYELVELHFTSVTNDVIARAKPNLLLIFYFYQLHITLYQPSSIFIS